MQDALFLCGKLNGDSDVADLDKVGVLRLKMFAAGSHRP
jgi:hypothetical protein